MLRNAVTLGGVLSPLAGASAVAAKAVTGGSMNVSQHAPPVTSLSSLKNLLRPTCKAPLCGYLHSFHARPLVDANLRMPRL